MRVLRCVCAASVGVASALACFDASPQQVSPTGVAAGTVALSAPLQTFGASPSTPSIVSSDVAPGYSVAGGTSSNVAPATSSLGTSIVTTTGTVGSTTVPAMLTTPSLSSSGLLVPTVGTTSVTSGGAASAGNGGLGGVATSGSPTFVNDLFSSGGTVP